MRYARRIRGRRIARRINRKRARKIRTFKLEKRKLGLSGQLVYAGLPERKKMFLTTKTEEMAFYKAETLTYASNTVALNPKNTVEYETLWLGTGANAVANWDKLAVSRIYIKIMPNYNNYTGGGSVMVPQFTGYYVIGDTTGNSVNYVKVKQLINFDGSKPFTVLLEKPSVVTQYGAAVYRSGTYLSLARLGKPATQTNPVNPTPTPTPNRGNPPQPDYSDEESEGDYDGDEDVWGDEQDNTINNHFGNFVITLDNPELPTGAANAIKIRYKVFYKVHLRG